MSIARKMRRRNERAWNRLPATEKRRRLAGAWGFDLSKYPDNQKGYEDLGEAMSIFCSLMAGTDDEPLILDLQGRYVLWEPIESGNP